MDGISIIGLSVGGKDGFGLSGPALIVKAEQMLGAQPVDICLSPFSGGNHKSPGLALLADHTGGLWELLKPDDRRRVKGQPQLDHMRAGDSSGGRSGFVRVCYGTDERQAVVALEDAVRLFVLEIPDRDRTIFLATSESGQIRDLAGPCPKSVVSPIRVLVTEKQIVWFDISKPSAVALRYRHHLVARSALRLATFSAHGILYTILWCSNGSTCTLFATTTTSPVKFLAEPSTIGPATPHFRRAGLSISSISADTSSKKHAACERLVISELGMDGCLYQRELACPPMFGEQPALKFTRKWDATLLQLDRLGVTAKLSDLDARKHSVADWRKVYAGERGIDL